VTATAATAPGSRVPAVSDPAGAGRGGSVPAPAAPSPGRGQETPGEHTARPPARTPRLDPGLSFFPTPAEVADDLVYLLLEPWNHFGEGHLIRAIQHHLPKARITAVKPAAARAATLRALRGADVVEATFEDYLAGVATRPLAGWWEPFHLVVMNPRFTLSGRREAWAEHVLAVYDDPHLLAPCRVIGAVAPRTIITGQSKRVRAAIHPDGSVNDARRQPPSPPPGPDWVWQFLVPGQPHDGGRQDPQSALPSLHTAASLPIPGSLSQSGLPLGGLGAGCCHWFPMKGRTLP
jgi:hypothetical protein